MGKRIFFNVLNYALPIVLLCVLACMTNVYPFGSESFLTGDLKYQYIDFFTWFRGVLLGDHSIFYSFSQSLGANTWGLYSYYLASPFNLLIVVFPEDKLTLCIFIIVAIKLGLIQTAATWYCMKRFDLPFFLAALVSFGYTWSAWTITNLRNPMWLDGLYLLPVMSYGVWRLVRTDSWRLLSVSIAASIIFCWYIAYMQLIYLTFLLFVEMLLNDSARLSWKRAGHIGFGYAKSLLLALLLSAWTFIPTVLAMSGSAGGDGTSFVDTLNVSFSSSLAESLRSLTTAGLSGTILSFLPGFWCAESTPQLCCGFLLQLGTLFLLFSSKVPKRKKIVCLVLLVVVFASVLFRPLEAIWCGFRVPNAFYSRVAAFVAPAMLFATCVYLECARKSNGGSLLYKKLSEPNGVSVLLFVFLAALLLFNGCASWKQLYVGYTQDEHDEYVESSKNQIDSLAQLIDLDSYRFDKTYTRADQAALNEGLAAGYNALSSYSSAHNSDAIRFLEGLGYSNPGEFSVRYSSSIMPSDCLLSLGAFTSESRGHETSVHFNDNAVPIGFVVPSTMDCSVNFYSSNPFANQNLFMNEVYGDAVNLFEEVNPQVLSFSDTEKSWSVDVPAGKIAFAYIKSEVGSTPVAVAVDGGAQHIENIRFEHSIFALNNVSNSDESHVVSVYDDSGNLAKGVIDCLFYLLGPNDFGEFAAAITERGSSSLKLSGGNRVEGSFYSKVGQSDLLLSIPNEPGWSILVNGEKREAKGAFGDAITLIPIEGGENRIEMIFVSPGFYEGVVVSLFASSLLLLSMRFLFCGRNRLPRCKMPGKQLS